MTELFVGSIATAANGAVIVSPVLTAVQDVPAFVVLNTPPVAVPAKSVDEFVGSIAKERPSVLVIPLLMKLQLTPAMVLVEMPLAFAAYKVDGLFGSNTRARTKVLK